VPDLAGALAAGSLQEAARLIAAHLDLDRGPSRVWVADSDGALDQLVGPPARPTAPAEAVATSGARVLIESDGASEDELVALASLLASTADRLALATEASLTRRRLADTERVGRMGSFDWEVRSDTNHWSDELFRLYGLEPGSPAPGFEQFLQRIHPEDREEIRVALQHAIATGTPFEIEERIVRPDGEIRILSSQGEVITDAAGEPLRVIGVCRDLTEQRSAEASATVAHDQVVAAEVRRRQALELNDTVVQGLVTLLWHLGDHAGPEERRIIEGTLDSAKRIMADLLHSTGDELDATALLRTTRAGTPPPSPATRATEDGRDGTPVEEVRRRRVVVADDAADLRVLLRHRLRLAGHVDLVGEAEDGGQAVQLVEQLRPDTVLLDLSMPVLDGLGAARRIRALAPSTRIIVFSGYPVETMLEHALAAGADAYVEKTSDLSPLLDSIAPGRSTTRTS
jgi:CheY-like chemotaxis protein